MAAILPSSVSLSSLSLSVLEAVQTPVSPQIRIPDELAGAVESYVAATIALKHFHTAVGKNFGRGKDVRPLCVAAQSNDRRMFEQKKNIADAALLAQFDEALLQAKASSVVNRSELDDGDQEQLCNWAIW